MIVKKKSVRKFQPIEEKIEDTRKIEPLAVESVPKPKLLLTEKQKAEIAMISKLIL